MTTRPATTLSGIGALLVDLDGTIFSGGAPLPGAAEALEQIERHGIQCAVVTNVTSRTRSAIAAELARAGCPLPEDRIFTAPLAARAYLLEHGFRRCDLLLPQAIRSEFQDLESEAASPEAVVLGDLGAELTFERLNRAFRSLLGGAAFVTLGRNRYFRTDDGLTLDAGPFVAALEYASGREATVVGKPSPLFFRAALAALEVPPREAAMVGDDIEADVAGAQRAGLAGILVRTGKFRPSDLERADIRPDAIIDSLASLPSVLGVATP
jgi:HAD superfamily hydrolase (TIGR01458 family)